MATVTTPATIRRLRRESWGFAVGSTLFFVGALPPYASWAGPVGTNATFVAGSVFFTLAAFIQLSLSGRRPPRAGTNPADRADWWAAAIQFAGTLLFNVSTIAALIAALRQPTTVGAGWIPDAWGSAAFLISSGLAVIATKDRGTLWDTDSRTWHGTWLNLVGSVAFGVSAVGAYVVPATGELASARWANLGTALGALCFLAAALLARRTIAREGGAAPAAAAASPGDEGAGYDPGFLREAVALPMPLDARTTRILTYPRFTVALDPARRLAAVTAVNIDGATLRTVPRTGDWHLDPRVPDEEQAGSALYARNDLDRGHLVRRRDPGWGAPDQARAATEATFCYTNAAPQVSVFNQSKDLWLGLEDHVLAYAEATAQRVSVFTAPILADDDPRYRGIGVPRRFFKIAAWSTTATDAASELRAAGFVLDQSAMLDAALSPGAVPDLGAYLTFQAPIFEIAALARLDVGPLADADVLAGTTARAGTGWRSLRAPEDVLLGG